MRPLPAGQKAAVFYPRRLPAEADHILDRLYPLLPNAVFGYQPAWEPLYRAHPGRFSADIRAEQQAAREAAARRAAETAGSAAAPAAPRHSPAARRRTRPICKAQPPANFQQNMQARRKPKRYAKPPRPYRLPVQAGRCF